MLLVDLSGSMRDKKSNAAVMGVILLCETLNRLQVNFSVQGFQDILIPLINFHQPFGAEAHKAIVEIPQEVQGNRVGGNNQPSYNDDGPCLLEAAELLIAEQTQDRMLIVVSDGLPEGRHSDKDDLRRAIEQLNEDPRLDLIALGLGPQTSHVSRYYPRSVASVPVEKFAEEIGRLIEEIMTRR